MVLHAYSTAGQAASPGLLLSRLTALRFLTVCCVAVGWIALSRSSISPVNGVIVGSIVLVLVLHSAISLRRTYRGKTGRNDLLIHIFLESAAVYGIVLITGGSANPFIYYLLVLVAISAALFDPPASWFFTFTAVTGYSVLFLTDVSGHLAHMPNDFQRHLLGMWINFVGSALLVTFFISRLATALREQQTELALAREETLKAEQLAGIGTLAASTVHALGTPLSTLTVMLDELRAMDDGKLDKEDISVMLTQIARCKATMQKLSLLAEHSETDGKLESAAALFRDLQEHYAITQPAVTPRFHFDIEIDTIRVQFSLLLRHALINLIDNALDAAGSLVDVKFGYIDNSLYIDIEDDGDGFPEEFAGRIGYPVVSTKKTGLGIGMFLANSTIEKLGGSVRIISHGGTRPECRTILRIRLPTVDSAHNLSNPGRQ